MRGACAHPCLASMQARLQTESLGVPYRGKYLESSLPYEVVCISVVELAELDEPNRAL